MDVNALLEELKQREGGYVHHKNDRGGPTNWGITLNTYTRWLNRQATIDDIKVLSWDIAKKIYLQNYYYGPNISSLPDEVRAQIFDIAVNSGPVRAIKMLQHVLNLAGFLCEEDGLVGPQTIRVCEQASERMGPYLTNAIAEAREHFYIRTVAIDPTQQEFLNGWLKRANSFKVEIA